MFSAVQLLSVMLVGFITTSSSLVGAALGLYVRIPKRVLGALLAFAAGSLISALAIDLAYSHALELHDEGYSPGQAWLFIAGGFALGASLYFLGSRFLERRGAAVRRSAQFDEYAIERKNEEIKALVQLLSQCDLMRDLPPEEVESLLLRLRHRKLGEGEVLFRAGEP